MDLQLLAERFQQNIDSCTHKDQSLRIGLQVKVERNGSQKRLRHYYHHSIHSPGRSSRHGILYAFKKENTKDKIQQLSYGSLTDRQPATFSQLKEQGTLNLIGWTTA